MNWLVVAILFFSTSALATTNPDLTLKAKRIYKNLNVTSLSEDNRLIKAMVKKLEAGKVQEAAEIAAHGRGFYNVQVKEFASIMGAKNEQPDQPLNDFQAMFIGVVRDQLDARTLLSGNFTYAPSTAGQTYANLQQSGANFADSLTRVEPQTNAFLDTAGVLTSQGWASEHLLDGTNRRAVEYTFREFLCTPLSQVRDVTAEDFRVRRDIDRAPGGNAATYQSECRGCHTIMDPLGGAFAKFDFVLNKISYKSDGVASKMNIHGNVYPDGFVTSDDSWINLATRNHNESIGWKGTMSGNGVKAYGEMMANTENFKQCMVKRVYNQLCRRTLGANDFPLQQKLASQFEKDGFDLKKLFLNVATDETCGSILNLASDNVREELISEPPTKCARSTGTRHLGFTRQ